MPDVIVLGVAVVFSIFGLPIFFEINKKVGSVLLLISLTCIAWFIAAQMQPWKVEQTLYFQPQTIDGTQIAVIRINDRPIQMVNLNTHFCRIVSDDEIVKVEVHDNGPYLGILTSANQPKISIVNKETHE